MMNKALLLGAAASLASAAALPVPSEQFFSVPQAMARPGLPGPVAMAKTYGKFNKAHAIPADVKAAAAAAQTGTVSAANQPYDSSYVNDLRSICKSS